MRGLKLTVHHIQYLEGRRTLTGAWIETLMDEYDAEIQRVAPSRVRGLKRKVVHDLGVNIRGRTLTGAWIETV